MNTHSDYLEINRRLWNEKTKHHFGSPFYDVPRFLQTKNSLKEIELELLGDVHGKSLLHLQCHFGMDSLSLVSKGAAVTGVDLSDGAITAARELAMQTGLYADFICCNVYDLQQHLDKQFDIVFTSYGVLGWLPDMQQWAKVVSRYLKPGGIFVLVEFHPVVWMLDSNFSKVEYSYFNKEAIIENESGTYADRNAPMQEQSISWNHGMAEVLQALIDAGLTPEQVREYDYSPYNCFNGIVEHRPGKYQIAGLEGKLPIVYALRMRG